MCEEIRAFVALNVLFGIKSLPETILFWSKNPYVGVPAVQKVMLRNRFEKIPQCLHLNNWENMLPRGDPNFDKLLKYGLCWMHFLPHSVKNIDCQSLFQLTREWSSTKEDLGLSNICP